jgi:hypothetical protein
MSLTALDRFEISELVAKFSHCSDYGDWHALAACFTPDVVTYIAGEATYVGVAAQVAHAKNSAEWTQGQNRHLALNLWIEAEGPGAARAHYYVVNFAAGTNPGDPKLVVSGRMTDHVVRGPAGWLIARREFEPDQQFTVPDGNAGASAT